MSAARFVGLGVLFLAATAQADPSMLLSTSRVDSLPRAAGIATARLTTGLGIGGGVAFPWTEKRSWGAEALVWTGSGVLETRGGVAWQLWKPGLLALSAQTGAALHVVGKGAFDLGLGPELGLSLGLGRERWEVSLGAQTGLELFVRTGGPRFPLRGVLQARYGRGPLDLTLFGRAGADYENGTHPTIRAEAGLLVGWRR